MTNEYRPRISIKSTELTLTSGQNKGNRRIWIEGKALVRHGFTPKTMLSKSIKDNRLILKVTTDAKQKKHSIAGTDQRPILDLCGKWVTAFMHEHPRVRVEIRTGTIIICPTHNQ